MSKYCMVPLEWSIYTKQIPDRKVDYRWAGAGGRGEWAVITEWVHSFLLGW